LMWVDRFMFKWAVATLLVFVFPFVGVPLVIYLWYKHKQAVDENEIKQLFKSAGFENEKDYSSKTKFLEEVNRQIDNFEQQWRNGALPESGPFGDPTYVKLDGINWSAFTYKSKCNQTNRDPIAEIVEDFQDRLEDAKKSVDFKVESFSKLLDKNKADIIKRIKGGEKRSEIISSYRSESAPSSMKIVKVHCENNIWTLSILDQIMVTSPGMNNYILEIVETNPESLKIEFTANV